MPNNQVTEHEEKSEVYTAYGLAMFQAHCLEKTITGIISGKETSSVDSLSIQRYDYFFDEDLDQNFWKLINILNSLVKIQAENETRLKTALRKRNWLAHQYWWDRTKLFKSVEGRKSMIGELNEACKMFSELGSIFSENHKK
ncbi:MAG: hypothetical protein GY754_14520 [bacterium]|nr:hypothetical protein [bacterium]